MIACPRCNTEFDFDGGDWIPLSNDILRAWKVCAYCGSSYIYDPKRARVWQAVIDLEKERACNHPR